MRLILHLLFGLLEVALIFPMLRENQTREARISRWARKLCHILNIQVINNAPSHRPSNAMLVANHISWLDIFVLDTVFVSRFVAKAEVRNWPFIGWLCQQTGTLFIKRERRHDTHKVNKQIAKILAAGNCVAIFPEGGTTCGMTTMAFNASLLQPAVDAHAYILPVALSYYDQYGQRSTAAAYIGEMSLLASIMQLVNQPLLEVRLHYFPLIASNQSSRKDIANQARLLITNHLSLNVRQDPQTVGLS
ncbi:lysophospholipid acyltransferase family protein [Chitinimonas sp. BJB300]|uniref:lysophospholipid acyltransferase family protein n=1 Tax=Chitinimonas sp. BJB300 TaxID=1559339 RepID=UPI000C11F60D|nr:lysophospholipid acyltransferase family protein [Chitinimonas sp. BJB300]PHV10350.1 1-acyl-sn-glycerol-3-phosphate acyltransferase [Chitinimonas sp. BJB300]